jgi:DNA polymerase III psi subunit
MTYQIPIRLWRLSTAEVAQSPRRISQHAKFMILAEQGQERSKSALLQDVVTALGAVTSDVTESPYSLLPHVVHACG